MFFFTPRYLKHGRQFIKDARKLVAYKRDLVEPEVVADVEREIAHLEHAVSERNEQKVEAQMDRLNSACGRLTRPEKNPFLRENVEVFLVAIVIALAVRTYFLQPFTIPTGSMQPTLNGILSYTTAEPPPNPLLRALHFAAFGRTYLEVTAKADEKISPLMREVNLGGLRRLFTYTELTSSAGNTYLVNANVDAVRRMVDPSRLYKQGEPIVRGYVETGDHVFVDKFSYHFRKPRRGEVFVFTTAGIPNFEGRISQYYIKRLAGLPNDTLRIDAPQLYVNGKPAEEAGMLRVAQGTFEQPVEGYRGYGNIPSMSLLRNPAEEYRLQPDEYFALGDNSYSSSDSRDWGPVPEQNLMGRAVFVYWPFTKHWSFIH